MVLFSQACYIVKPLKPTRQQIKTNTQYTLKSNYIYLKFFVHDLISVFQIHRNDLMMLQICPSFAFAQVHDVDYQSYSWLYDSGDDFFTEAQCAFCSIQGLDWEKVSVKAISAPFKPEISSDLDTSNFSEEFTLMPAAYSPAPTPSSNAPCPFRVSGLFSFSVM